MQNGYHEPKKQQQELNFTDGIDLVTNKVNGNILITLFVYVKHMEKSK